MLLVVGHQGWFYNLAVMNRVIVDMHVCLCGILNLSDFGVWFFETSLADQSCSHFTDEKTKSEKVVSVAQGQVCVTRSSVSFHHSMMLGCLTSMWGSGSDISSF